MYCLSRKNTEEIAAHLNSELGRNTTTFYHAGIEAAERARKQDMWSRDRIRVIVATIAFGMGINKPDVRYVVHYSVPKTITGFYQESGRAGRDGRTAECMVMYAYKDIKIMERMIKTGGSSDGQSRSSKPQNLNVQLDELRRMSAFCENEVSCRRELILEHFGERFASAECAGTCDNCSQNADMERKDVDVTEVAKSMVRLVDQATHNGMRITENMLVGLIRGQNVKNMARLKSAADFGAFRGFSKDEMSRVLRRTVMEQYLAEEDVRNRMGFFTCYVKLGQRAFDLVRQGSSLRVNIVIQTKRKQKSKGAHGGTSGIVVNDLTGDGRLSSEDQASLNEMLKMTAAELAEGGGAHGASQSQSQATPQASRPWWVIFPKTMLEEIAMRVPLTRLELEDIGNLGKKKIDKTGCQDPFLKCTNHFKKKILPGKRFEFRTTAQKSKHFSKRQSKSALPASVPAAPRRVSAEERASDERFREMLVLWREQQARADSKAPHAVISNAAIDALVARRPRPSTLDDLKDVRGIGTGTRTKYGMNICSLCMVCPLPALNVAQASDSPAKKKKRKKKKTATTTIAKKKKKKKKTKKKGAEIIAISSSDDNDDDDSDFSDGDFIQNDASAGNRKTRPRRGVSSKVRPMVI